jgi:hypothetical protein
LRVLKHYTAIHIRKSFSGTIRFTVRHSFFLIIKNNPTKISDIYFYENDTSMRRYIIIGATTMSLKISRLG